MEVIAVLLFCVSLGFFSGYVAKNKNRSFGNWFILGCLFNVIALIAIVGLPPIQSVSYSVKPSLLF